MSKILFAGESDVGFQRNVNEDFLYVKELDPDTILAVVADGAGSTGSTFQPASIAVLEIINVIKRLHEDYLDALVDNAEVFLVEAFRTAGRVLGAFQTANEELYNGYAASVACCLIHKGELIFAHTGNTRINLVRKNKKTGEVQITLLTKDQTAGQVLLDAGRYTFEEYHLSPERLKITGGLGVAAVPTVQTFRMPLRPNDFILMTTDGIHYAVRPDAFLELLRRCDTCQDGVRALICAAKELEYADNMTAVLLWNIEDQSVNAGR